MWALVHAGKTKLVSGKNVATSQRGGFVHQTANHMAVVTTTPIIETTCLYRHALGRWPTRGPVRARGFEIIH